MKVVTIVGARPQFIKAVPVSRALEQAGIQEFLLHTGQHYDAEMSDVFFKELELRPPDLNLHVGSGSHGEQTAAMLVGIERALVAQKPDWVLIYGDTNSTLAGAVAAAKLRLPVAHVEAGLRSFNRRMPEELNRIVADALSTLLFVPTENARQNLVKEGVAEARIVWTGDVMLDAALMFRERALANSHVLTSLGLSEKGYLLATVHRAENTDSPARLKIILDGLNEVARELPVIFPVHPRTRIALKDLGFDPTSPLPLCSLRLVAPVGFLDMLRLEMSAAVIATDSGGVQKEAFFHGVPCVTLRDETEWVETVALGWNRLVSTLDPEAIAQAILAARGSDGHPATPYGDGQAVRSIVEGLTNCLPIAAWCRGKCRDRN